MSTVIGWLTNDPDVARRLDRADRAYEAAKAMAGTFPLAEKVRALRLAKALRDLAYREATEARQ